MTIRRKRKPALDPEEDVGLVDTTSVTLTPPGGPSENCSQGVPIPAVFLDAVDAGFLEDKAILEAQQRNVRERPGGNRLDIKLDAGPNKLLWLLDKLIAEEQQEQAA